MSVILKKDNHGRCIEIVNTPFGGLIGEMTPQEELSFLDKLEELTEKGTAEDKYRFGKLISKRKICKENDKKALPWMKKAAEGGHVEAMIWVGIEENNPHWLKKAIEQGDENAKAELVRLHLRQGQIEEALSCVENAENYMYGRDFLEIGTAFLYGTGIKKDIDKAIYYLEKVAEKKDLALILLAQIYLFSEKGKEDKDKAISWINMIKDTELRDFMLGLANNKGEN